MEIRLKDVVLLGGFALVGLLLSCGEVQIQETTDPVEQLAEDIQVLEDYLAEKGFVDYDTLESDIRVVVLSIGDGEAIEFEDIVQYDYVGKYTTDELFDTSVPLEAFKQDTARAVSIVFRVNEDMDTLYDEYNLPIINEVEYEEGYIALYSESRVYEQLLTTHTPGGWYLNQQALIEGFKQGVHATLERVNLNGSALILIPSELAYGPLGSGTIGPNTPLMFEIRPKRKR